MIEVHTHKTNSAILLIKLLDTIERQDALNIELKIETYIKTYHKLCLFVELNEQTVLIDKGYISEISRIDKRFESNYLNVSVIGLFGVQKAFHQKLRELADAPYEQYVFDILEDACKFHTIKNTFVQI